ncbi:hypothetical protein C0J52_22844, partial [Blattella germanica]
REFRLNDYHIACETFIRIQKRYSILGPVLRGGKEQTSDTEMGTISSKKGITTSAEEKEPQQPTPGMVETLEKMDKLRVLPKRKQALKAKPEAKDLSIAVGYL